MKQKIEWYREVLEIEPSSRIFFPLARLLVADKQISEAIIVLTHGITQHPEYIEARLFLVNLLAQTANTTQLHSQVNDIAALLSAYPQFFTVWADLLQQSEGHQDTALALRFFTSALQGQRINWGEVIEHGLRAFFMPSAVAPTDPSLLMHPQKKYKNGEDISLTGLQDTAAVTSSEHASLSDTAKQHSIDETSCVLPTPYQEPSSVQTKETAVSGLDEGEGEENLSLCTRSMAEVLAEQGDFLGAADIYRELLGSSHDSAEKKVLEERLHELTAQSAAMPVQAHPHRDASNIAENSRLADLLESLAQRLEARAHD